MIHVCFFRVLLVCILLCSCAVQEQRPAVSSQPSPKSEAASRGNQLYADLCKGCHGLEGRGGVGPDLTVTKYRYGKSRDNVIKSVAKGRPAGMPPFASRLSAVQIEVLADFVLSLK